MWQYFHLSPCETPIVRVAPFLMSPLGPYNFHSAVVAFRARNRTKWSFQVNTISPRRFKKNGGDPKRREVSKAGVFSVCIHIWTLNPCFLCRIWPVTDLPVSGARTSKASPTKKWLSTWPEKACQRWWVWSRPKKYTIKMRSCSMHIWPLFVDLKMIHRYMMVYELLGYFPRMQVSFEMIGDACPMFRLLKPFNLIFRWAIGYPMTNA